MASVKSPFRRLIKPLLMKYLGPRAYQWFLVRGKIRDIDHRLVEEAEMALLPRLIGHSDTVIDIGANYAYYTVRMARLCPTGKVIAFEPIPTTFDACRRIVRHYRLKNVDLHKKGVGAKTETRRFEVPVHGVGAHSAGQAHLSGRDNGLPGRETYHPFDRHESFDCEIAALDELLVDSPSISFVKMDIEGAEYFALQGMKNLLERHRPTLLMEICPYFLKGFGIEAGDLDGFLRERGYSGFHYDPLQKVLSTASVPYADGNYVFVHRDSLSKFRDIIPPTAEKVRDGASRAVQ